WSCLFLFAPAVSIVTEPSLPSNPLPRSRRRRDTDDAVHGQQQLALFEGPAVPRFIRSTLDHLSRRTDRCQWQGRRGLSRDTSGFRGSANRAATPSWLHQLTRHVNALWALIPNQSRLA